MHELSIAQSIHEHVVKEINKRDLKNVSIIALRIGALTDIVPDSLEFGFDAIKKDTILDKTVLDIEIIPVSGVCKSCKKNFEVLEFVFVCPDCSSYDIKTENGTELDIAYLEVDT
jgi:hydrogenase nickel incorporation protein HypA/HybF